MRALGTIIKALIICCLWSIIFIDGIRVLLLVNWHFDIFLREHWSLLRAKWNSGASISTSEIGFFIIVISSIPLWFSGFVGLCLIKWKMLFKNAIFGPLYLYRKVKLKTRAPVVIKKQPIAQQAPQQQEEVAVKKTPIIKKAVKRPMLPSEKLAQLNANNNVAKQTPSMSSPTSSYSPASKKDAEQQNPLDHALFNFDDDDFDLDFDLDKKEEPKKSKEDSIPTALVVDEPKQKTESKQTEKTNKPAEKPKKEPQIRQHPQDTQSKESHTPVMDVLTQKGYDVIPSIIIKNTTIDYMAVSKNQILLCLVDREPGDWLADEEKFNDEEPLWFSESSHRISPVRKLDIASDILKTKLAVTDFKFDVVSYVVIQSGNIINAEDMFDIWSSMKINVTRINRGSPKEIRLFSKSIEPCEAKTYKDTIEKLKKLIYSMA